MKYKIIDKPGLEETSGDVESHCCSKQGWLPSQAQGFFQRGTENPQTSFLHTLVPCGTDRNSLNLFSLNNVEYIGVLPNLDQKRCASMVRDNVGFIHYCWFLLPL